MTVGKSLEDVSEEWVYDLKKRHVPQTGEVGSADACAPPLGEKEFAVKPVALADHLSWRRRLDRLQSQQAGLFGHLHAIAVAEGRSDARQG